MNKLLFLLLLPLCVPAMAQKSDTVYYNSKSEIVKKPKKAVEYIVTYYNQTDTAGYVRKYNMKGQVLVENNYSSFPHKILNGMAKTWYENGKLASECLYMDGKPDGSSKRYWKTGTLKRDEFYIAGKMFTGKCYTRSGQDTTYFPYDIQPAYNGGVAALYTFLGKTVVYPPKAMKKAVEGRVLVSFVVDKTGKVTKVALLQSAGNKLLDKEALRVVKLMPEWKPGLQDSEPVNVKMTLPVVFKLKK